MSTINWIQKWAERLIQIKEFFEDRWEKITDEVALQVLWALESREVMNDEIFNRMLEYAVQISLINLKTETAVPKVITYSPDISLEGFMSKSFTFRIIASLKNTNIETLGELVDFIDSWFVIWLIPNFWPKWLEELIKVVESIDWFPKDKLRILKEAI